MIEFAVRNLTLFFRDRAAVFLSFLAELIIVALYVLFIRDGLVEGFPHVQDAPMLADVWMISGVLGVTAITSTMGAYSVMVDDRVRGISMDFVTSPLSRTALVGGYALSAALIGLLMSGVVVLLAACYVYGEYGILPGASVLPSLLSVMVLSAGTNSAMLLLPVSFLKSSNALAACCTVLGTLIGFLTAIYIPMGSLPEGVQWVVKCFAPSHSAVLFRRVLLEPFVVDSFGGYTQETVDFIEYMGIRYAVDGGYLSQMGSAIILMGTAFLLLIIAVMKYALQKNR